MYCKNCGNHLNEEVKFCANCGSKVENELNSTIENSQSQIFSNVNQNQTTILQQQDINKNVYSSIPKNSKWKSTTSLVIGIVSLILSFIFQIFSIPLSIVGAVFGIISVKDNKVGLILNIISLVIAITILLAYSNLLGIVSNPVLGTWDCKAYNSSGNYNDDSGYIVTMKLEKNNRFKWNKYNDEKNNYIIGEYELVDLHKTNYSGTASYYSIILTGDEFVNNGVLQTELYKTEYKMGIVKNSDEAVMINVQTYNMYYCYRNSK